MIKINLVENALTREKELSFIYLARSAPVLSMLSIFLGSAVKNDKSILSDKNDELVVAMSAPSGSGQYLEYRDC